jgi:hypothetical protein
MFLQARALKRMLGPLGSLTMLLLEYLYYFALSEAEEHYYLRQSYFRRNAKQPGSGREKVLGNVE